jgi:hypothetical protein
MVFPREHVAKRAEVEERIIFTTVAMEVVALHE